MASIFNKVLLLLFILICGYAIFGITHFKIVYHQAENPKQEFFVSGDVNSNKTLVEYTSYACGICKKSYKPFNDFLDIRKDFRHVVRPILLGDENADRLVKLAIAAGLQGKFWEIHTAFMEYPEVEIPDEFIEETSLLYGLNYGRMLEDVNSREVNKIAMDNIKTMTGVAARMLPSYVVNHNVIEVMKWPSTTEILQKVQDAEK